MNWSAIAASAPRGSSMPGYRARTLLTYGSFGRGGFGRDGAPPGRGTPGTLTLFGPTVALTAPPVPTPTLAALDPSCSASNRARSAATEVAASRPADRGSRGMTVNCPYRLVAASAVTSSGADTGPEPVTVMRSSAPTLTVAPTGWPDAGSSRLTSTTPRRIVTVARTPTPVGDTS